MDRNSAIAHTVTSVAAIAGICYIASCVRAMGCDGKVLGVSLAIVSGIGGYNILTAIRITKQK
jgi:hypothetical protein